MSEFIKWSPPYRDEDVAYPEYDLIRVERDGAIGRIVFNSPEKRNPLGYERLLQLAMAAKELELDDDIRVIIIKGEGPSFSSGYDITPVPPGERPRNTPVNGYIHPDRDQIWQSYDHEHLRVYFTLWDLQKPVIAQIQGYCLAGATELAAFCDIRIVADDAQIGWPVGRNWSPGNIQYMPWVVNITKAKYYMLTNQPMDGIEAYRCGWASKTVPADELEAATEEVAATVALTDTDLAMITKRSLNRQQEIMGFRTGMHASAEFLAVAGMRHLNRRRSAEQADQGSEGYGGDEFSARALRDGLTAALTWRDQQFGMAYRTSDAARQHREDTDA